VSVLATQVGALARRSVTRTARQPASAIPPLVFPLALLAVNSGGLQASTELPGFPSTSFLAFALAVPFIQGALFSTMNAGTDLARDIQTGFFTRLSLTPMRGSALLTGQLTGIVVLGVLQAVVYTVVGLLVGVRFASGPLGIVVLFLFAALVSLGFGALGSFLALRTGSGESIQGLFPVLFVFLFISSMNAPRDLMEIEWFRIAASANPVSYLIECVRSLIITGWDTQALLLGFGVAVVLAAMAIVAASWALGRRMERT
jgi:ABC-2 type transport system permease protein